MCIRDRSWIRFAEKVDLDRVLRPYALALGVQGYRNHVAIAALVYTGQPVSIRNICMKSLFSKALLLAVLLSLVAACTTAPGPTTGVEVISREPDYRENTPAVVPAQPPASPTEKAPYADLVKRAGTAREAGDFEQALALLERAQRIDPDSADIYLALAETHRARGNPEQARATAERGLLYCRGRAQCDALRWYIR